MVNVSGFMGSDLSMVCSSKGSWTCVEGSGEVKLGARTIGEKCSLLDWEV